QGPPSKPKRKSKPKPPKQELLGAHSYDPSGLLVVNPLGGHPIPELIHHAEAAWAAKLARASTTLRQAAAEYTRRYARPPPKGFDMWWAYTAVHDVRLPDEYDQIDRDLAPFYGVAPTDLQEALRALEAHEHFYTIGKNGDGYGGLEMLNYTLPQDALAAPGFEIIELMREVEAELPPFRAAFNPYDAPNLVLDYELRQQALDAARKGTYIDSANPPPAKVHGWLAACPPHSRARLDADSGKIPPPSHSPKTFIHDPLLSTDPCLHPTLLRSHGAYVAAGTGPDPRPMLVPQFSYSVTPLHADVRIASPLNWVAEGRPPPLGLSWAERVDVRLQWRGRNTGIWHAIDSRWRETHRVRLAALGAGMGSVNVSRPRGGRTPVGGPLSVPRARILPALLDVAFAGPPINCEPTQCAVLEEMFEWQKLRHYTNAVLDKYVIDVDGNGWSSRFKRLMNSGSLIFKATTYPEWFTDRLAPWVHYVPIQNSYTDLLDALVFFRAHDEAGARIAAAGREWSRRYWRTDDLTAYMYRLFLEYARVMSTDRATMSFEMWADERQDAVRERALKARWERKRPERGGAGR
ncbi:glycosyl transferase family 90-domain-containing protein, partial [Mycena olivaceomarginata]